MLESKFKKQFLKDLEKRFPEEDFDYYVTDVRSKPDTLVVGNNAWAALEFKRDINASEQPNQDWHLSRMDRKGYAAKVHPQNREEVLHELENVFGI